MKMKNFRKYIPVASVLLLAGTLFSCKDDETVQTPLAAPANVTETVGITSVSLTWDEVKGMSQYGVTLYDAEMDPVEAVVTKETEVEFTGLTPSSDYTVSVWAYAPWASDKATSAVVEKKIHTGDAVKLAAPVFTRNQLSTTGMKVNWSAVANATGYECYYNKVGSAARTELTVTSNAAVLTGLERGTYEFNARSVSTSLEWLPSDYSQTVFTYAGTIAWKKAGTYTSVIKDASWSATIECISDGVYSIPAWYGTVGYYLDFTADSAGNVYIVNYTSQEGNYVNVPVDKDNFVAINQSQCAFSGNSTHGQLILVVSTSNGDANEIFTW